MSPTVFKWKSYRFYFFSREEIRPHVHVSCPEGEAKFWLEPEVGLARNHALSPTHVNEIVNIVEEKRDDILDAWRRHFSR